MSGLRVTYRSGEVVEYTAARIDKLSRRESLELHGEALMFDCGELLWRDKRLGEIVRRSSVLSQEDLQPDPIHRAIRAMSS
jgi:hypothetical protein